MRNGLALLWKLSNASVADITQDSNAVLAIAIRYVNPDGNSIVDPVRQMNASFARCTYVPQPIHQRPGARRQQSSDAKCIAPA